MSVAEEVSAVQLTPAAASKLGKLLEEKNMPGYGLRVFVAGGGCSGMQYGMAFYDNRLARTAVVVAREAIVRQAPVEESASTFTVQLPPSPWRKVR